MEESNVNEQGMVMDEQPEVKPEVALDAEAGDSVEAGSSPEPMDEDAEYEGEPADAIEVALKIHLRDGSIQQYNLCMFEGEDIAEAINEVFLEGFKIHGPGWVDFYSPFQIMKVRVATIAD
jgi:hypothetical protein